MTCPDHHCCKGECYQYCNVVICGGNSLNVYSSSCKIPVGQIDCLDVVEYNVASCNHDDTVQVDDGFLHVRNKCRATFKICSGPGFKHHEPSSNFPDVPNSIVPNTKTNNKSNTTSSPTTTVHQNIITTRPTQTNNNQTNKDGLHTHVITDLGDGKVVGEDLAIGIGIGVCLAFLAVIGFVLCRCYYMKRKKKTKTSLPIIPTTQSTNQTGNPMYGVDGSAALERNSSISDRYEEVRTVSETVPVSRTCSEPKYESIKSYPVKFRPGNDIHESQVTSNQNSIYQTVADDISKQNLNRSGSDVIYSSYFRDGICSNSSSSTHYFILDPDETQEIQETEDDVDEIEKTENMNKQDESTYFVLEEQSEKHDDNS